MTSTTRLNQNLAADPAFFGVSALLLTVAVAVTIEWCASMSTMGGMRMPGGWTMSMAWMRMPGETWPGATASFLGMWVVMMVAMMLPSLIPALWRYRNAVGRSARLTALAAAGYFFVWAIVGIVAFPLGIAFAIASMRLPALARAVPVAAGLVILIAGATQFTSWKARHLACCRGQCAAPGSPWQFGVRLGVHCACCCSGLMAILLVLGVMDLRAMAAVGAAVTLERLAPEGERIARITGAIAVATGLFLIARV